MNLKHLTDEQLTLDLDQAKESETRAKTLVLHHLNEFDRRKLYSAKGYPSLYAYATGHLKYSEDEACRRIASARLLREVPQIEQKMEKGKLSLSHISYAQKKFRQSAKAGQPLSAAQKLEVLVSVEGLSTREAQRKILAVFPETTQTPDRIREIGNGQCEIQFAAPLELRAKIEQLRGLLAHRLPDADLGQLVNWFADAAIEKLEREKKITLRAQGEEPAKASNQKKCDQRNIKVQNASSRQKLQEREANQSATDEPAEKSDRSTGERVRWQKPFDREPPFAAARVASQQTFLAEETQISAKKRRALSRTLRRFVWERDEGQCQNCVSTHALEMDQIQPVALGGDDEPENLRLLCRSCNQREAIQKIGKVIGRSSEVQRPH